MASKIRMAKYLEPIELQSITIPSPKNGSRNNFTEPGATATFLLSSAYHSDGSDLIGFFACHCRAPDGRGNDLCHRVTTESL
jgi:hypothetical protein